MSIQGTLHFSAGFIFKPQSCLCRQSVYVFSSKCLTKWRVIDKSLAYIKRRRVIQLLTHACAVQLFLSDCAESWKLITLAEFHFRPWKLNVSTVWEKWTASAFMQAVAAIQESGFELVQHLPVSPDLTLQTVTSPLRWRRSTVVAILTVMMTCVSVGEIPLKKQMCKVF